MRLCKVPVGLTFTMEYHAVGNTDLKISILGFGASPLGNAYGEANPAEATRAVHHAIHQGINLFDVSPYYGLTLAEKRLGEAIEGHRNEIVLMTKCGRYGSDNFDFSAPRLHRSIDESLSRLRTDHVDILLAHDIEFVVMGQIIEETIPALRSIQQQGKARYIGVSGLPLGVLKKAAETKQLDLVLSYCRYNLMNQDLERYLTPTTKQLNIGLINASPLHMGMLTSKGAPDWHPAPVELKQASRDAFEYCRKAGSSLPEVALRFALDYNPAASTLVGMSTVTEVERNLKTLSEPNDPSLLAAIREIIGSQLNRIWASGRPENSDALLLGIPQT